MVPEGGSKGVFGTNPLAFAWPRRGREPFVFDFATSAIAAAILSCTLASSDLFRWVGR
ncbi:Ldh family oxidoreductase [Crenobacter oryzisoli]|uniref:Ldh family oxidoreductase n=1 Tax=Crenobacter oryzisoli TaxID=3056844 RepID=UPI00338DC480